MDSSPFTFKIKSPLMRWSRRR